MAIQHCKLALENGLVFTGTAFGATGSRYGEVVFNTSMTGYQEILTDPSYAGQIVTMTYPLIGNYGVNEQDIESACPHVQGFVVKELASRHSNYRAEESLDSYLEKHGIIGLAGVDTRAITRQIRIHGAMTGYISTDITDDAELVRQAKESPSIVGTDLVSTVTCDKPYQWDEPLHELLTRRNQPDTASRYNVVAIDCGVKRNILRHLVSAGCDVTVVSAGTCADDILARKPDGVFVSNGPGDPDPVTGTIEALRGLVGQVPIFGICLGQQLLCLAMGADRFKLKFGHRGANQPVKNMVTGRVEITSQNHGFGITTDSLERTGMQPTHVNLNDNTLEGFTHTELPVFAVQYHPEASPGPHDAAYLFDLFTQSMSSRRPPTVEQVCTIQAEAEL